MIALLTILDLLRPDEIFDVVRIASILCAAASTVLCGACWPAWRAASTQVRLLGNALLIGIAATGIGSVDQLIRDVPGGVSTLALLSFQLSSLAAWAALWRAQRRDRPRKDSA